MIRRYLDGYHDFNCIADKCPATCCSGWAIEIDEVSLEAYREISERDPELFEGRVDWEAGTFTLKEGNDCSFLRKDGLCEMFCRIGEGALCDTCTNYPRHMEEFPGVREYSLSASCPVAAHDLFVRKDPLVIKVEEDDEVDTPEYIEETYEDFDQDLYDLLYDLREDVFDILKDRSLSFEIRGEMVLELMRRVQEELDEETPELIAADRETIRKETDIFLEWEAKRGRDDRFADALTKYHLLYDLEALDEDFTDWIDSAEDTLFADGAGAYCELVNDFESFYEDWDIVSEQLAVYFAYTYMCGAVYDNFVFAMTAQSVFNADIIKLMVMAAWEENDRQLSDEEISRIIYRYSRELENSTENVIRLEQLIDDALG